MIAQEFLTLKQKSLEREFEEEVLSRGLSNSHLILSQTTSLTKIVLDNTKVLELLIFGGIALAGAVGLFLASKRDVLNGLLGTLQMLFPEEDYGVSTGTNAIVEAASQARDQLVAPITQPGKKSAIAPSAKAVKAADMRASESIRNKIKNLEGLSLTAYKDESTYSIGYGHAGAKPGQKITKAQAEQYFNKDITKFEDAVRTSVKVSITQNQFDALVSFTYNVGIGAFKSSTLLKKLNRGDYSGAQAEFSRWVYGDNNKKIPALVKRRKEEADLFGKDVVAVKSAPKTNDGVADKIVATAKKMVTSVTSSGWCAKYVHDVMDALGISMRRLAYAYMYIKGFREHPNFIEVSSTDVQPGDFVVYDRRGVHKAGHIFISDGGINSGWSDFRAKQQLKNPSEYGSVHVFRYLGKGVRKQDYNKVKDSVQKNAIASSQTETAITKNKIAQNTKKPVSQNQPSPQKKQVASAKTNQTLGLISYGTMDKLRVPKKA